MFTKKLKAMRDILLTCTNKVYHYRKEYAGNEKAYIVWNETAEDSSFHSDNEKCELKLQFDIELYVRDEFDPIIDQLVEALNSWAEWFTYDGVDYEMNGLIHHSFTAVL